MSSLIEVDSPYIREGSDQNFTDMVIGNSTRGPVLVNYWSPKAGPCLRLYPIIDKLTRNAEGKFLLVNLNVETERRAAALHGVTSVPTLKLFKDGVVQETLHGYQNEQDLKKALFRHVPRASDAALKRALGIYAEEPERGLGLLAQTALDDPENPRIVSALSKLLVREARYEEALRLIAGLPHPLPEELDDLHAHLSLIRAGEAAPDRAALEKKACDQAHDDETRFQLAAVKLLADDYAGALADLLVLTRSQPPFRDGIARRAMQALFKLLGDSHPLVSQYRWS